MDWLQFFSSIIGSLAWPAVVAYLLYLLRAQLGSLAARLTELTLPGGAKALFKEGLIAAKDEALVLVAKTEGGLVASEARDQASISVDQERYIRADTSPRKSILDNLIRATNHVRSRVDTLPLQMRREPYDFVFENLRKEVGGIELYNTFTKLREMSAVAYNSSENRINSSDANSYADICSVFISSFDRVFEEWHSRVNT